MLLFEFPSQGCIFSGLFLVLLLPVFYPGATHLLTSIRLALTSVLPANTGTSQNALALMLWYSGFGVVGEYHGGTLSMSSRSSRSSKNRILRAPLCLATYLVCASALHPAITCAILSGHSWHIQHIASLVVSVRVLFWLYNFVGTSCWYSSNSPAMVFVGASCHLYKQLKQSTRSVSIHRVCINFLCHFWKIFYNLASRKRWTSSSILLPLQRECILSSREILPYLPTCFNTVFFLRDFFVLNLGKQKGCSSF